jgi:hypothetical protein
LTQITLIFINKNSFADTNWVSETALDPPSFDTPGINNANDLATEALFINENFRRQTLKRDGNQFKFEHAKLPTTDDEDVGSADTAYKYRTWNLGAMKDGTPITLVARTEHDAVMQSGGEIQKLTIKAFNEWDSSVYIYFYFLISSVRIDIVLIIGK